MDRGKDAGGEICGAGRTAHAVNANQVFQWLRQDRRELLGPGNTEEGQFASGSCAGSVARANSAVERWAEMPDSIEI